MVGRFIGLLACWFLAFLICGSRCLGVCCCVCVCLWGVVCFVSSVCLRLFLEALVCPWFCPVVFGCALFADGFCLICSRHGFFVGPPVSTTSIWHMNIMKGMKCFCLGGLKELKRYNYGSWAPTVP